MADDEDDDDDLWLNVLGYRADILLGTNICASRMLILSVSSAFRR